MTDPAFRPDLYRGTARAYDQFRRPYPAELLADLTARARAHGTGRLLDLGCGTGQVAFALSGWFAEIWAVDQEPEMIEVARDKAYQSADPGRFRFVISAAEELAAPSEYFDLVTIGNAFHRLPRAAVAAASLTWLRPGGFLALLWGGSPDLGDEPWQRALTATMRRWQNRPGAEERIPAGYQRARDTRPDAEILTEAGFEIVGRYSFTVSQAWTADDLAGYVASTSVLSAAALGEHAGEFDAELRRELSACQPDGVFRNQAVLAYDLARRPDQR
ncbi:MAG: class I SAM-dependent methyltransferase, partial [Actinobacteria bacterium]|nr:class I SAM-dependent methyltransferase [Actinomycetota bacterium]